MLRATGILLVMCFLANLVGCGGGVSEKPPATATTADTDAARKGMEESMKHMKERGGKPPM